MGKFALGTLSAFPFLVQWTHFSLVVMLILLLILKLFSWLISLVCSPIATAASFLFQFISGNWLGFMNGLRILSDKWKVLLVRPPRIKENTRIMERLLRIMLGWVVGIRKTGVGFIMRNGLCWGLGTTDILKKRAHLPSFLLFDRFLCAIYFT